jgi:hypothetical protein
LCPPVAMPLDCSFLIAPSLFSNVYSINNILQKICFISIKEKMLKHVIKVVETYV